MAARWVFDDKKIRAAAAHLMARMYEAFDSSSELPSGEENRHREQVRALASVLFNGAHGSLTYAGHLVEAFWGIGSVECLHDISGQLRDILQYGQDEDDTVNMARLSACCCNYRKKDVWICEQGYPIIHGRCTASGGGSF